MSKTATDFSCQNLSDVEDSGVFADFKDSQGRFRTQSLFWESRHPDYNAYFTTKKHPHQGMISLYEKYMAIADPTEYQVAIQIFGSWEHWQALLKSKWFVELVTEWREELKVQMESERYFEMKKNVKDPKTAVAATKWLADRYTGKAKPTRGRPSAQEKKNHLRAVKEEDDELTRQAKDIGLL